MREILFRAWDKKSKKMREIDSIAFNKDMDMFGCESVKLVNLWGYDIIEQKDIIVQREGKSFVLMEYTGLKDKNGVKIFEGDICSDNKTILQVIWSEKHQWVCKVIKGGTLVQGLVFPLWQWDKCPANGNRELEVIGNIYENPELLGVE